jgi:glycosyltransferase involved in cell wall biosynthesis
MGKKNILHFIESLGIGGAETLLVNTVNSLATRYNHFIVYLKGPDTLASHLKYGTLICLNYKGKQSLPVTILKLRSLIQKHDIDLVHSHLLWPTFIARLACPRHVRFIFTVHNLLSEDAFKVNKLSEIAEKLTYTKNQDIIFVSEAAQQDYDQYIGIKGKSLVLYNFVDDKFFHNKIEKTFNRNLSLVAVGNLKVQKNYLFLLEAFKQLKGFPVRLDIYGEGPLKGELQQVIDRSQLPVRLMGRCDQVEVALQNYDVFVMASLYEGFGISLLEAMASGLPVLVSDIPVFREVTKGNALFFVTSSQDQFLAIIHEILNSTIDLNVLANQGYAYAKEIAGKESYLQKLVSFYENP